MLAQVRKAIDRRKGHIQKGKAPRRLTHRANAVFALVRSIMRWAVGQGITVNDPTHGMKKPIKKEAVRDRELSASEIATFWNNIDKLPTTPGLRIAMKLSLVTAQRIGEVCGIDGPIEGHAATVAMFRGRGQLDMAHFRIHDLRRTAATRMAEIGINPYTISLVLNHVSASKSTITGKVYVQYSFDREKREALNTWGARLLQIITKKDVSITTENMKPIAAEATNSAMP
jgi:integrase